MYDFEHIWIDKAHTRQELRPERDACLQALAVGDILHTPSLDRLATSITDLVPVLKSLEDRQASLLIISSDILVEPGSGLPPLPLLAAIEEFEKSIARERQAEGIAKAKKTGKRLGRKPKLTPMAIRELRMRLQKGETKTELAKEFGVSRQTIYMAVR